MPSTTPDFRTLTASGASSCTAVAGDASNSGSLSRSGSTAGAADAGASCADADCVARDGRGPFGQSDSNSGRLGRSDEVGECEAKELAATSSRGVVREGAAPFVRREVCRLLTAVSTSVRGGINGDSDRSDRSASPMPRMFPDRAEADILSDASSSRFSSGAVTAPPCGRCADLATLAGKGIRTASLDCVDVAAASGASPGRAARGIGRAATTCSIRCKTRRASPRPSRTSPPTAATIPGVTRLASKARSWIDTPDAARTIPAAVNTAPNTNKSKYIRLSPALATQLKSGLEQLFWRRSRDRARRIIRTKSAC